MSIQRYDIPSARATSDGPFVGYLAHKSELAEKDREIERLKDEIAKEQQYSSKTIGESNRLRTELANAKSLCEEFREKLKAHAESDWTIKSHDDGNHTYFVTRKRGKDEYLGTDGRIRDYQALGGVFHSRNEAEVAISKMQPDTTPKHTEAARLIKQGLELLGQ